METLLEGPIDTRSIIEETNKRLIKGFQIDPDDPIVANVILNQVILEQYLTGINRTLADHRQQLLNALATEEEAARKVASQVITQSTDYLVENIQATGDSLQERLTTALQQGLSGQGRGLMSNPWLYGLVGLGTGFLVGLMLG